VDLDRPLAWLCRRAAARLGAGRAVARRLRAAYTPRLAGGAGRWIEIGDYDGDLRLRLDRGSYIGSTIYWTGYHHRRDMRWLGAVLRPGMVFVDVGANIGEFTLFGAKRVGSSGKVLAFEPGDAMVDVLARNVAANRLTQVEIHRIGLGDRDATLPLFAPGPAEGEDPHLYSTYRRAHGGGAARPVQTIRIRPLDDVLAEHPLERLDVMKIDVEGGELPALEGARATLARHRPRLMVEFNRATSAAAGYTVDDLARLLVEQGYALSRVDRRGFHAIDPARLAELPGETNVIATPARGEGSP